jgi:ribonuclease D
MTPTGWIRTREDVGRLAAALAGSRAVALDSESDSLYHHLEKVCLVQVATERGEGFLIDTLAVRDLAALGPLIADPGITKVFHGADYDVTTMKRDFGFRFAGVFDTMIASRFLGFTEIGLRAVAARELGVSLSKDSQKDDWSRRPLQPAQEAYALADVRHLLALHDRLRQQLQAAGRLAWAEEECAAVANLEMARRRVDPDAYQKVKGARQLPARNLAVLREVFRWREGLAEATDRPAFKILSNESLLALATASPRSRDELRPLRLPPRALDEAASLLEAVARGLAVPAAELPAIPREPRPVVPEPVRRRREALKVWRNAEAVRLALDPALVLPQRLIDRLADDRPRDLEALARVEGLRRWRAEAFGPAMLKALGDL